jgi:hypothetical protein
MWTEADLEAINHKAIKAQDKLRAAVTERKGHLRMSIPARPDDDDDCVINDALGAIPRLVSEVRRLRGEVKP